MNKDLSVLSLAWILTILMLIIFVPKARIREAYLVFITKQAITWLVGLVVTELRLIEYPVDLFRYATKSGFSFEYFIFPAICVVFNLHYPDKKSHKKQLLYYFYFCTAMTVLEVLAERYTNILKYMYWEWYATWITLFMTFFISRRCYVWFFRKKVTGHGHDVSMQRE